MIADELKKIIKGDVLGDEKTLIKYSRDASLFEVKPEVVAFPKDVEDLKKLVSFVSQKSNVSGQLLSLTVRAGGTDMTGAPLTESIVLDMAKYFNRIKEIGDNYVLVEAGVFY